MEAAGPADEAEDGERASGVVVAAASAAVSAEGWDVGAPAKWASMTRGSAAWTAAATPCNGNPQREIRDTQKKRSPIERSHYML